MRYLTFALCKGRLAKQTLELLEKLGITCEEMKDKASRKLIFVNEDLKLRFFLAKGPDVPTYVEYGAADIGVVGKDIILEEDRKVHEVLDLKFGTCNMCVCGARKRKRAVRTSGDHPGSYQISAHRKRLFSWTETSDCGDHQAQWLD